MKKKYIIILSFTLLISLLLIGVYLRVYPNNEKQSLYNVKHISLSTKANVINPNEEEIINNEDETSNIIDEQNEPDTQQEENVIEEPKETTTDKKIKDKKEKNALSSKTYRLRIEYNKKKSIKSIIKVNVKGNLNTKELGHFTKTVTYKKTKYTIIYDVVDTTPPVILGGNKSITKGSKTNLVNKFLCGDNYDDTPKCKIIGDYDRNTVGKYKLKYKATDSSGNTKSINFTLTVKEKSTNTTSTSTPRKKKPIKDFIKKYKNKNTMIGVDVSSWQDEIDWAKAKKAGVEFAIIRIGFGHTNSGEIKMDKQFQRNIKNAKKNKIKVGLYFFSYAENEAQAKEHALWIVRQLDGEKLDLPVAYDWENWGSFNSYKMSFTRVHNSAQTFITTLEKHGYKGMLYSSAYYLTRLWGSNFKNQWLAYYTSNNDYTEKPFMMWQATSSGKVDGIPGYVDIDILYKNKIK